MSRKIVENFIFAIVCSNLRYIIKIMKNKQKGIINVLVIAAAVIVTSVVSYLAVNEERQKRASNFETPETLPEIKEPRVIDTPERTDKEPEFVSPKSTKTDPLNPIIDPKPKPEPQPIPDPKSPFDTPEPVGSTPELSPVNPPEPPVADVGTDIETFIDNANFPKIWGVSLLINEPQNNNLSVFKVTYGNAQDCESGCFFSKATGIKYGNKIGWVAVYDYEQGYLEDASSIAWYDFSSVDSYLLSEEFETKFRSKGLGHEYQYSFLPLIAEDKDTPHDTLLNIAKGLYSYIQPPLGKSLLENPTVKNSQEILETLAELPYFGGVYEEVREEAQELLN